MVATALGATLLVAILFPKTPLGRAIRELLIELPARKLKALRRSHWFALVAALIGMVAVAVFAKTEGAMFFASGLPDIMQWFLIFDVATYMDVIGILVLLAASVRFRAVYTALLSSLNAARRLGVVLYGSLRERCRTRALHRRPPRLRGRRSSNDDEESWRPYLAFA